MDLKVPRPASLCPDATHAHCHHSREPFDAAFRCINERRDISSDAKLVHARLVTIHRTGRDETQAEIGEALGLSRHQVWRAICELVAAGLVQVIRYGLGRPNGYVLLGLAEDDLRGRASASRPARPGLPASRETSRAGTYYPNKNKGKKPVSTLPSTGDFLATREGSYQLVDGRMVLKPRT